LRVTINLKNTDTHIKLRTHSHRRLSKIRGSEDGFAVQQKVLDSAEDCVKRKPVS